jgi:hypothetical protein
VWDGLPCNPDSGGSSKFLMKAGNERDTFLHKRLLRFIALAWLLAVVAKSAVDLKYSVHDPDTWWHVKTGDWIIEHGAVPRTGIFSWTANRPWVAYSWGFEVLLSRVYAWFNLMGLALFGILLTVSIAYFQFWSLQRISGRFWTAWLLAICSLYSFLFVLGPRPVFFSIIFYIALLTALLEANRSGQIKNLYWLPALFLIWANMHIQFIYGLFVLGLFVANHIALNFAQRSKTSLIFQRPSALPTSSLLIVSFACAAATLIGPYSYHLYQVIFLYSRAKYSYQTIIELQPLAFHLAHHYAELLLMAAGFGAVGWQKKIDPFKLVLMTIASLLAFRTIRDCWFAATTAAALIADFPAPEWKRICRETLAERGMLAAIVATVLFLLARNFGFNEPALDRLVSSEFPVDAVNYLRQHPVPGPLYNNLDWGGFLIWYMPQFPVAIDGRNDLYGDSIDRAFYDAQYRADYKHDPYLFQSGFVLLSKKVPLANALRLDDRFRLVYEDKIAVVFVRHGD